MIVSWKGMTDSNSNGDRKEIEEEHSNGMNLLPIELSGDIISRLPIKSIIQFRLACKSWKKLSCDPVIVNKLLSNSLKRELECLIFHCSFFEKNSLYFVNLPEVEDVWDKEKVNQFEIPFSCSMPRFKIVGSCNGILCLVESRSHDVIYVYNPFTRDYIMLHEPPAFPSKNTIFGFGYDSSTNRYKVIRIVSSISRPKFSEAQICCLGSYKWRSIVGTPYQLDRRLTPVLLNGRIHWIASRGSYRVIVSFDLLDEVFREVPIPPEICFIKSSRDINGLAILGGCLSVAAPLPPSVGCLDIWIMIEYCKKESWIKQFTIGRYLSNFEATYLPSLSQVLKDALDGRSLRVLSRLRSGKLLLAYRGENLVCYDPESSVFNHITFRGLPNAFRSSLHVASLKWIDASSS